MNPKRCYYQDCHSWTDEDFNRCSEFSDIAECPSHNDPMINKVNAIIDEARQEMPEGYLNEF